jgi:hypothetical protein
MHGGVRMSFYGVFMTWAILNEVFLIYFLTGRVECSSNSKP